MRHVTSGKTKKIKDRIAALIFKGKKFLIVSGLGAKMYWTPGGKRETGESHEETLTRELKEELNVEYTSSEPYLFFSSFFYDFKNGEFYRTTLPRKVFCYIVKCSGTITPSAEIDRAQWYGRRDFKIGEPKIVGEEFNELVLPKLIEDGLI